jgi:hypothetical protein
MHLHTKILIILGLILIGVLVVAPVGAAVNWTYNPAVSYTDLDIANSTYLRLWLPYLINVTNTNATIWEFPVIGFASSLTGPFTDAFQGMGGPGTGNILFIILIGIYFATSWRQSGSITIPAMIFTITSGAIGLIIPPEYQIWLVLLVAAATASTMLTWLVKE